jgi:hypothetical protein
MIHSTEDFSIVLQIEEELFCTVSDIESSITTLLFGFIHLFKRAVMCGKVV